MTTSGSSDARVLLELAERCEKASGPDRDLDAEMYYRIKNGVGVGMRHHAPEFTGSLHAARSLGGLCVFASDIGADGLPMVKIVSDTSTTPIVEYTGIAATLELAWCAAALRAKAALSTTGSDGVDGGDQAVGGE